MDSIPLFFCLFRLHRLRCSTWKIHLRLSVVEIWTPSIEAAHGSITCLAPGERKIIFSFFPSMNLTFAHELRYNISFPSRNLLNYFLIFRWISSSTFWLGNFFLVEKNNFLIVESFQFVRQSHKTSSWNDELRIAGDISQTLTNVSFLFLLKKHKKKLFYSTPVNLSLFPWSSKCSSLRRTKIQFVGEFICTNELGFYPCLDCWFGMLTGPLFIHRIDWTKERWFRVGKYYFKNLKYYFAFAVDF